MWCEEKAARNLILQRFQMPDSEGKKWPCTFLKVFHFERLDVRVQGEGIIFDLDLFDKHVFLARVATVKVIFVDKVNNKVGNSSNKLCLSIFSKCLKIMIKNDATT